MNVSPKIGHMNDVRLLSTGQIAAILEIDTKTANTWADEGLLPCTKTMKGHRRFDPWKVRDAYKARGFSIPRGLRRYLKGNGEGAPFPPSIYWVKKATTRALLDELAERRANGDPLLVALDEEERAERKRRAA